MSSRVQVEGVDQAAAAIRGIGADAHDLHAGYAALAAVGVDATRGAAPSRTGALRGSVEGDSDGRSASLTIGVPYWPFQDLGTRYVRARRFVRRGADVMTARAPELLGADLARDVARRT